MSEADEQNVDAIDEDVAPVKPKVRKGAARKIEEAQEDDAAKPPVAEENLAIQHLVARALAPGSKGPEVSALQRRLGVPETGTYDRRTENAVRNWQAVVGRAITGRVDIATWQAMSL